MEQERKLLRRIAVLHPNEAVTSVSGTCVLNLKMQRFLKARIRSANEEKLMGVSRQPRAKRDLRLF